eukprot:3702406-Ditylum_brightwellii.AAC.1
MPFGLRNCPVVFLAFMHDMREQWEQRCEKQGVKLDLCNGSTVIMDDTFLYTADENTMFAIMRCVCELAREKNLTWKLKKCRWFPQVVEFVSVDVSVEGNRPAQSKMTRLQTWKDFLTPRDILSFIGFAIFYMR